MSTIDVLIWLFLVAIPLQGYLKYKEEKEKLCSGEINLSNYYWKIICTLWAPAILVLMSEHFKLSMIFHVSDNFIWGVFGTLLFASLMLYYIRLIKYSPELQSKVNQQMVDIDWLMPKTNKELNLYIFGICTTAGIAEEIIYRGYLLPFLTQYMDQVYAIIVSSLLFGLPHIYQKLSGVIITAFIGLIFCIIVVFTESLFFAILCHFMIDAYSGYISYLSSKKQKIVT